MTVGELIVFNSTIPEGGGTVLEHLMHIRVTRDSVCSLEVNVKSGMEVNINSAAVVIEYNDYNVGIDSNKDSINIDVQENELGVINACNNTL